jgi:hypothetical protein
MNQRDLHRAVARITGESVTEISHRGFQPVRESPEEDLDGYIADWDRLEAERNTSIARRRFRSPQTV